MSELTESQKLAAQIERRAKLARISIKQLLTEAKVGQTTIARWKTNFVEVPSERVKEAIEGALQEAERRNREWEASAA